MIHEPLTKLQCSPTSDGAAAVIVASERYVDEHDLWDQAVEIAGQSMVTDMSSTFDENADCMTIVGYDMSKEAARQAYEEAGITADEVDVCELHDCFSANELITYEALGFAEEGEGHLLVEAEATTYGGDGPVVNPSGGLISKGHPLGATGLAQCSELTWQLRGQADKRQVEGAEVALQHNIGLGGAAVVSVYGPAEKSTAPVEPATGLRRTRDRFTDGPPHELFDELRCGRSGRVRPRADGDAARLGLQPRRRSRRSSTRPGDVVSSWEARDLPAPRPGQPAGGEPQPAAVQGPAASTRSTARSCRRRSCPNSVAKLEADGAGDRHRGARRGERSRNSCDFVADVAVPIPLRVLADLMGLPDRRPAAARGLDRRGSRRPRSRPSRRRRLRCSARWPPTSHEQIAAQKEAGEREPRDDAASTAEVDGESLTDDEILVFFGLLIFAGNDTTRNTMSGGMLALLEHPDQLELLRAEPERIEGAVEEILRWTSVVNYFCRTATGDTEVGGCPVGAGDKVMLWYPAGSRDPEVNDDPQALRRHPRRAQAHGLRRRRPPLLPRRRASPGSSCASPSRRS